MHFGGLDAKAATLLSSYQIIAMIDAAVTDSDSESIS